MKHNALYKAIALSMGLVGFAGVAAADELPVTVDGASIKMGSITVTPNAFIEAAVIDRNRNQVADVTSKPQALPLPNTDNYHTNEFRMSGRQSRVAFLAQGPDMDGARAEAYYEADFLGAGVTSNSTQSNSYVLRMRQAFADYTLASSGFQILGGQAWSLVTQNKEGIKARGENSPATIDAQYVAGFNWTRNAQIRLTEKFNDMFTGALSFESPQAVSGGTKPTIAGTNIVTSEAGGSLMNNSCTQSNNSNGAAPATSSGCQQYTTDSMPDIVAKVAVDPGFGHYEVLGLNRHFRDRVDPAVPAGSPAGSATSQFGVNSVTSATSFGANAIIPVVPKLVDFQASILSGKGIGRYGTSTLSDYTFKADGSPVALKGQDYLLGLTVHPTKQWDIYLYDGQEKVDARTDATAGSATQNVGYGLGTCAVSVFTCTNLQKVSEVTAGFWYKFYQGNTEHMQVGLQVARFTNTYFSDNHGDENKVGMNQVMASFRYYPFQK